MRELVVGIRWRDNGPLVFAHTALHGLTVGCRVVAEVDGERREALVAIPPDLIVAAPPLSAAPHVIAALPASNDDQGALPAGVLLLRPADSALELGDVLRALELAARPAPRPPEDG
jgi:hypothetical protein